MPELRKDPIIDRWVIIATERARRPADFSPEPDALAGGFSPFTPGNEDRTPPEVLQLGRDESAPPDSAGWKVRVVPNKYPALSTQGDINYQGLGMFDLMNGVGAHEVIIEHPDADWDLVDATPEEIHLVFQAYIARAEDLRRDDRFRHTLIFRNKGSAAGATIAHPHSQVIALPIVPKQVKEMLHSAREYYRVKRRSIFTDLLRQELALGDRVIEETEHFVVLSPFAARFPFEVQIFPRRQTHDFTLMTPDEQIALGDTLTHTLKRIKNALNNPAYNMMLHTAPNTRPQPGRADYWSTIDQDFSWHIDILPRLTKIAGFEWGTGFYINPVSPEQATQFLKDI